MTSRRFMCRWPLTIVVLLCGVSGFGIYPHAAAPAALPIDPSLYAGLRWRNIGPFRAGRVASVTGVIGQPAVFYMGLPAGGVWKTTSAGTTWFPVFDAVKEVASVGSIQVAPSDPNVIYAGTGDLVQGGAINEGNGVYKSTDAGKTWQHLPGLENTKNIPALLVDPKDPNLVLIAASGNVREKTDQRGVFRTTDGGRTWTRTLTVDDEIGAQSIAWAFDNPRVMLATTIRHYTSPGALAARGGNPGGGRAGEAPGGTSIYKSTDEGATWTKLAGTGLPAMTGRTTVAVAMNTNSQRMFVIGGFGLYRSDDGGSTWHQATTDRRIIGTNYLNGVYVHPSNPDIVYTVGTCSYRSLDGGKTFDGYKCAPGGDDPQQLWIDPTNGDRQFLGVDQGATITLDGGETWSSWYNQPTAQIYRISVDNSFPYWVHCSQQDACAVAVRSRGELGAVTMLDWYPTPAYEFGSIVADPLNPKIVYGVGWMQGIVKITYPSGQWINVAPNEDVSLGLRRTGNQLLVWNATNPHELLAGYQYLMATTDGGVHWKRLSPDLGYPAGQTPPPDAGSQAGRGGSAGAAAATGGTILSISTSSVAPGVIWVGTTNGLIKLTRDHGTTWQDVTMPNPPPPGTQVSTIDASHQDPATAYVSMDAHAVGDMAPYIYRTHDYGKTWTRISNGLATNQPHGSFVRVVRTDTKRAGLLFAGTESSVYVSFDDGDSWQSLMLNLPTTAFRDMAIKDNDLVVGTYGRSVWILDDFSPLRQITAAVAAEAAHLFKPGDAYRVRRNINAGTPFPPEIPHGDNPPLGAIIYYHLAAKPTGYITLDISDAAGRVVRHMSSAPIPPYPDPPPRLPDWWLEHRKPMPTEIGTNRINWNLRYDEPPAFIHWWEHVTGAVPGDTPASPEGPLVIPGVYTLKLTVDGKSYTQRLTVKNDPRSPATPADLHAQYELQVKLYDGTRQSWDGYHQVNATREAVARVLGASPPADVATAARALDAKLLALAGTGIGGRGGRGGPAPPINFTTINGTEPEEGAVMVSMNGQLKIQDYGDMAPTEPMRKAWTQTCQDLRTALGEWQAINARDLVAFNTLLTKNNLQPIPAASSPIAMPACTLGAQTAGAARGTSAAARGRGNGRGGR